MGGIALTAFTAAAAGIFLLLKASPTLQDRPAKTESSVEVASQDVVKKQTLASRFLSAFFVKVPQNHNVVLENPGGEYITTKRKGDVLGYALKAPIIQRAQTPTDMREDILERDFRTMLSDFQFAEVPLAIYFHVVDAEKFSYASQNPLKMMEEITEEAVQEELGQLNVEELFERNSGVKAKIKQRITEKAHRFGMAVTDITMTEIKLEEQSEKAFNDVKIADLRRKITVTDAKAKATALAIEGHGMDKQRSKIMRGVDDAVAKGAKREFAESVANSVIHTTRDRDVAAKSGVAIQNFGNGDGAGSNVGQTVALLEALKEKDSKSSPSGPPAGVPT